MDAKELEEALDHFTGSEEFHRYSPLFRNVLLTDGAHFLAEEAGAFWLMDLIVSHQTNKRVRAEEFQCWKLAKNPDNSALATVEDENGIITSQSIPFTDFPLPRVKLYASWVGDAEKVGRHLIIMLPSEY